MVSTGTNEQPELDVAGSIVACGALARELQTITSGPNPDAALVALKATELRMAAGVIRTWAMLRDGA